MPQLIQYLCPSWRLSLQGRPSALSQWVDRPAVHYDRAHLFRLSMEEDVPETLVWEGSAAELQNLQDALQNYIQDLLQRSHHAFLQAESAPEHSSLQPAALKSGTGQLGALQPETLQSGTLQSGLLQPETLQPETLQPETLQSEILQDPKILERGIADPLGLAPVQELELDVGELEALELQPQDLDALAINRVELDRSSYDFSHDPDSFETSPTSISSESSPQLRLETIGALGHRLWLSETIDLSLTTLECFDLAEVLDLWQTEALSLPPLPQKVPARMPPWINTAALILVTVGVSSTASTLGWQWWQNQQALEVARQSSSDQAVMSPEGLLLEPLDPLTVPPGTGFNAPNALPALTEVPANTEVYGPQLPGEAPVSLGISINGEQPLPGGSFAGLSAPPPPDFSQLPPPPGDGYSGDGYSSEVYTVLPPTEDDSNYGRNSGYRDNASDYSTSDYSSNYNSASDYASLPAPAALEANPEANPANRSLSAVPQAPSGIPPQAKIAESESVGDPAGTIATVRSYFQGTWQPIESLTEPLQYQLLIGTDGTLQAIIPLGDRAGNFLDRTGMPLLGESLSAPGQELLVTVVLRSDGGVEVY